MRFSRVNAVLEKFKGSERLLRAMQPYKISLYFILTPLHKERFPVAFFFRSPSRTKPFGRQLSVKFIFSHERQQNKMELNKMVKEQSNLPAIRSLP